MKGALGTPICLHVGRRWVLRSAIALSGNGLQLADGLDGNIVDVLLDLIVLVPLMLTRARPGVGP